MKGLIYTSCYIGLPVLVNTPADSVSPVDDMYKTFVVKLKGPLQLQKRSGVL